MLKREFLGTGGIHGEVGQTRILQKHFWEGRGNPEAFFQLDDSTISPRLKVPCCLMLV